MFGHYKFCKVVSGCGITLLKIWVRKCTGQFKKYKFSEGDVT